MLVQRVKLTHASFPPQWNNVVRHTLVILQVGKIACASFTLQWNDVV
jgi:hypothetical protein